jgi:hypothetical protein
MYDDVMTRFVRTLLTAAVVTTMGLTVSAAPAAAIPPVGPNQSVTFTYYSGPSKEVVVGEWSYGYCGEPFEWGTRTRYSTYRIITC